MGQGWRDLSRRVDDPRLDSQEPLASLALPGGGAVADVAAPHELSLGPSLANVSGADDGVYRRLFLPRGKGCDVGARAS
jgi:hypothetical protein